MESEAGDPAPAPPKLVVTQIDDYAQLTEELANLPDGQMITVVHYSTAWTEERTGTVRTESELGTILEKYQGIGMYVKVENAKTVIRMGVTVVPTFEFYRGRDKVDQCSGADMYVFRECLDMIDSFRKKTPYLRGATQGPYPLPTGTLLSIFQGT
jgi:hypothetical protein